MDGSPAPSHILPRRVVVVGVSGSGKTTAGRAIASILDAKHIELDSLFHGPNWTPAEPEVFRERIHAAINGADRWVTDGSYASQTWDVTWVEADVIVWLDYSLWRSMPRLFKRTMLRWIRREELWNGNRESLREHLSPQNSLFLWAIKSKKRHATQYPEYFARPGVQDAKVVRLPNPSSFDRWLKQLRRDANRH